MSQFAKNLARAVLSDTAAAVYTKGTEKKSVRVDKIQLYNTHGSALVVDLYVVPSGGAANATTQKFSVSLEAADADGCSEIFEPGWVFDPDDAGIAIFAAAATASKVNIDINGTTLD